MGLCYSQPIEPKAPVELTPDQKREDLNTRGPLTRVRRQDPQLTVTSIRAVDID